MAIEIINGFLPPDAGQIEVVERKGLGHPDTLTDGIAEASEIAYAQYCQENFGVIPHHNLDKAMLLGGLCVQKYGGNEFQAPVNMIFMGRASRSFGGVEIPLEDIQDTAARGYLARIMPHLDTTDPNVYQSSSMTSSRSTRPFWFSPRSINDLPEYAGDFPKANDTATMISYWPLTTTEQLALDLEGYFYSNNDTGMPTPRLDYIGQDIKVMAVRSGDSITATLCVPQVTTKTPDAETYFDREKALEQDLQVYAEQITNGEEKVKVVLNTQTKSKNPHPYLVTGGSCTDFGEEGAVGRGNKTHGIISSYRPNTMEAPQGKNPTYFVGKILGYLGDKIARNVYEATGSSCQVVLQANMGDNLFAPSNVIVSTKDKVPQEMVSAVIDELLSEGRAITGRILDEAHFIPRTSPHKAS